MSFDDVTAKLDAMIAGYERHEWTKFRPHGYDKRGSHCYCLLGMATLVCGGPITSDAQEGYSLQGVVDFLRTDPVAEKVVYRLWLQAGMPHSGETIEDRAIAPCVSLMEWNDRVAGGRKAIVTHIKRTKAALLTAIAA